MRSLHRYVLPALTWLCLTGPAPASELTVYAAASLQGALDDVAAVWRAEGDRDITLVYAGSSALARQIAAGAPADVFLSANVAWMDTLEAGGHIRPDSRVDLLGNRLVLIGGWHDGAPLDLGDPAALSDRLGGGRLALALTEAVPAGIYAREALEALDLWDGIAERVVESDNVRTVLALVGLRAAQLGVVYATDAPTDARVSVLAMFPEDSHTPIVYPVAATRSGDAAAATAFIAFLQAPLSRAILSGHGFTLLQEP